MRCLQLSTVSMKKHSPLPGQAAPTSLPLATAQDLILFPRLSQTGRYGRHIPERLGLLPTTSPRLALVPLPVSPSQLPAHAAATRFSLAAPSFGVFLHAFGVFPHTFLSTPWLATALPPTPGFLTPSPGRMQTQQHQVLISQGRQREGTTL